MELQEKLKQLTPEQQAKLTARINSGQLGERAQAGLDKFRQTPIVPQSTQPTAIQAPEQSQAPQQPSQPVQPKPQITQPKPAQQPQPITNIQQFKQAGANTQNLSEFISNRYSTDATVTGQGVEAVINGEKVLWTIDREGNPIKKSLGMTTEGVSDMVKSGQEVSMELKNTVEYKRATNLQSQLSIYKNMTAGDLSYAISQGNILPGTDLYKELEANNPSFGEAQRLATLNNAFGRKTPAETLLMNISERILNSFDGDVNDYKAVLSQNTEVIRLNSQMTEKQTEVSELKDQIDNLYEDLKKEYGGKGATKGYINAKYAERNQDLMRAYNLKLNEYNALAGNLERISDDVKYEMQLATQSQAQEMQKLQFLYGMAQDEIGYQRGLEAEDRQMDRARQQMEMQYQYTYGDLDSENPTLRNTAIRNMVADLYTAYPISGMETPAIKEQKVRQMMEQGMTGMQAIQQLEQEIRNTQRYKDYISGGGQAQSLIKMGDDAIFDPNSGQWIQKPGTASGVISDPNSIASFSMQNRGKENLQCGELVNDFILQATGNNPSVRFGDTLQSKLGALKNIGESKTPVEGGIFVSNPLNNNVGHVGIVQAVYGDGSIEVLEANASGKKEGEAPVLKTYTLADQRKQGMSFSQGIQNQTTEKIGFDTASIPQFQQYFQTGKVGASVQDQKEIIREFGSIEEFKRQAEEYGNSNKTAQYSFAQEVKKLAENLKDTTRVGRQISPGAQFIPILGGGAGDFEGDLSALKSKLSLQNLIDLKSQGATFGALSNQELNFITDASLSLRRTRSNTEWNKELDRIIKKMDEVMSRGGNEQINNTTTGGTNNVGGVNVGISSGGRIIAPQTTGGRIY